MKAGMIDVIGSKYKTSVINDLIPSQSKFPRKNHAEGLDSGVTASKRYIR